MERIIANGTAIYAKNQDVYTVLAANDGNDYIVEMKDDDKIWTLYMPPDESEDELECYEGPILALSNSKLDKTSAFEIFEHNVLPVKITPKKKTALSKPTDSPKFYDILDKEPYFPAAPIKKKVVKKLLK